MKKLLILAVLGLAGCSTQPTISVEDQINERLKQSRVQWDKEHSQLRMTACDAADTLMTNLQKKPNQRQYFISPGVPCRV